MEPTHPPSRRRSLLRACALALALALLAPAAQAADIASLPVAFDVINQNATNLQARCPSDGMSYTVRGHLVGPRHLLEGPGPLAVTQYLYGFDNGWHHPFPVPGYDWGTEMARLGHVSVMVDMLGYDQSGRPHGSQMCLGSQADVSQQIVTQLRSGDYSLAGGARNGIPFERVLLAGHDVAGSMAEIAAHSFHDLDGLILMTWADQGLDFVYLAPLIQRANETCAAGGEHPDTGEPGGGYMFFGPQPDATYRDQLFFDPEVEVIDAVLALRNRNPCGYLGSIVPSLTVNTLLASTIDVPVLLIYGANDPVFPEHAGVIQENLYPNSPDVSRQVQPNSGHFPWFERNAAEYRERVSEWLCSRGFASNGVACGSTTGRVTGGGRIDPVTGEPEQDPLTGEVLELATLSLAPAAGSSGGGAGGQAKLGVVAKRKEGESAPQGHLRYSHPEASLDLWSHSLASLAVVRGDCGAGSHARLRGTAEVNGHAGQTFEVQADDCGEPGRADRFQIRVAGPDVFYSASGVLVGGNLQVRP